MSMRIHVGYAQTPLEAGGFMAAATLLSHGIRNGVVAAVSLRGTWIVVESSRLRRLYPDADSLEGWVKAVLRGSPLGAVVSQLLDLKGMGEYVCLQPSDRLDYGAISAISSVRTAVYGVESLCKNRRVYRIPARPRHAAPSLVNIVWDRVEASLDPMPRCRAVECMGGPGRA